MKLISLNKAFVKLDSANPVDVVASWADPGGDGSGDLFHITNTTARVVVPPPGEGKSRRMTDLSVRALAANNAAVIVTVYQGPSDTDLYEVMSASLRPGDVLSYDHQAGWRVIAQALLGNNMVDIYLSRDNQLLI